jgi:flagellar motor switch protein FliM
MASVLRRKAEQARQALRQPQGPPGVGRALAEALRRAAEIELSLALSAPEATERRATPAELIEALPEQALLAVLIGPEDGAGLLALDGEALSAILEMRTLGRLGNRPAPARRPTRTDAAMVADMIDRLLAEFEAPLIETEAARWAAGWRYQLFLPEPRPLAVVLEEGVHRVLDLRIDLGVGARIGRALLALPATGRGLPRPAAAPPEASAAAAAAASWQAALDAAVGSAEVALDAVLGRVEIPLSTLAGLAPGDRLALPLAALGAVRLVAPGGGVVAEARLGQCGGLRAVRLAPGTGAEPAAPFAPAAAAVIPAGTIDGVRPGPASRHLAAAGAAEAAGDDIDALIARFGGHGAPDDRPSAGPADPPAGRSGPPA